jgi:hypothetical protein
MSDSAAASDDLLCPQCGYNLRGIQSDRCPECGFAIDRESLSRSIIPWTFRDEIGLLRAFEQTVMLAIRHPRRLGVAASRPVDYQDAQKFRWLVVLCAWLPLTATVLVIRARTNAPWFPAVFLSSNPPSNTLGVDWAMCEVAGLLLWPIPSLALLMLIAAVSGAASYFFHPRSLSTEQQNRGIAISYYACAPLALLFVPCGLFDAATLLAHFGDVSDVIQFRWVVGFLLAGGISLVGILSLLEIVSLKLLKAATHCSFGRLMVLAALLPLAWLILLLLSLGLFPAMCGFVRLVIYSYRG